MVSALEAFCDAIMSREGWLPGSRSNRNRNPGNLRHAHNQIGMDDAGYAVFGSLREGYWALICDVTHKCSGHTQTGLGPHKTVADFFEVWAPKADHNDPLAYTAFVCQWLTKALARPITPETRLCAIWQP